MNPLRDNPFNPPLAEGIGRFGFRKWYERELLSSHAHMVLTIFSVIGLLASLEASRGAPLAEKLMDFAFVFLCAAIGLWSLRRYLYLLSRAEKVAKQAQCGGCGQYGRLRLVAHDRHRCETEVCCRACDHRWIINSGA